MYIGAHGRDFDNTDLTHFSYYYSLLYLYIFLDMKYFSLAIRASLNVFSYVTILFYFSLFSLLLLF